VPGKSVLLVEDEDTIALALDYLIGRAGHRTRRVADGDAAFDALAKERPDLVLLDVMLPGRSGFELCQHIRARSDLAGTRILMMTARGGTTERRKGLALGADAFLTKPFDMRVLDREIARLLGEYPDG
jgi:DNA-binding response OmpR family regulator